MALLLALIAVLSGIGLVVQTGVNGRLGAWLGAPLLAAVANFAVGAIVLVGALLATRTALPAREALGAVPPWGWAGGFLGGFFVLASIVVAPRLGAGTYGALLVAGLIGGSLVVDHFGLLGFSVRHLNAPRLLGGALFVAGVSLVRLM